ncbi:hypothetical protein ACHAWU_009390 [Discostella pseudostelligera]|uniref:Uncharacterized protein n=1 Tax=Discostella pseudostelligera TaxID=259834 RepID=A0ABD3LX96_9STRA
MDNSIKYTPVAVPICGNGGNNGADDVSALEDRFVTDAGTPTPVARPFLEVVAPATLPEGYTFEAEANGHTFNVTVPMGGVEEGQRFSVPFTPGINSGVAGVAIPRVSVPVGQWKDGLCDCFRFGFFHPHFWNACYCPLVLAGQIMHRLRLTWLGNEGSIAETASNSCTLLSITVVYFVLYVILFLVSFAFIDVDENGNVLSVSSGAVTLAHLRSWLAIIFRVFILITVARTRWRIRSKYSIPEKNCRGCEDCCCAFWCTCCTLSQMARHTADYETYAARCCSETGLSSTTLLNGSETELPVNTPSIV